jgi:hypothetical protein
MHVCQKKQFNKHLHNRGARCELVIHQLVRFLVVEPAHQGSSPRLGTGVRIFLDLFQDLPALCIKW